MRPKTLPKVDAVLHSQEAEESALGAAMTWEESARTLIAATTPEDFFDPRARRTFEAILDLEARGIRADLVNVADKIRDGGFKPYLLTLMHQASTPSSVTHYAEIIRRRADERRLVESAERVIAGIKAGEDPSHFRKLLDESIPTSPQLRLLTLKELAARRAGDWLIDGLIPKGSFTILYGPAGGNKTFVGFSIVCSVASGKEWFGRAASRGKVIVVAAEGVEGLNLRIRAWMQSNPGADPSAGLWVLPEAVNLLDDRETDRFAQSAAALSPLVIVFDPLARMMVGGDENSAKDTGRVIANIDRIKRVTGATVLAQHHSTKTGEWERGSSALRGAADTMLELRGDERFVLKTVKQKDAAPADPIRLRRVVVELEDGSSCVIRSNEGDWSDPEPITPRELEILRSLQSADLGDGLTKTEWRKVTEFAESTFHYGAKRLISRGFVRKSGDGRGARFRVTSEGESLFTPKLQSHSNQAPMEQGNSLHSKAPLLRGLEVGVSPSDESVSSSSPTASGNPDDHDQAVALVQELFDAEVVAEIPGGQLADGA